MLAFRARMAGATVVTDVDLVQGHTELGGEVLLDERAGLVLHLEVLLEDVVLFLCEARLHVACGRLWGSSIGVRGPACLLRRAGRVHGRHAATVNSVDATHATSDGKSEAVS
jgi:hypothetical protein